MCTLVDVLKCYHAGLQKNQPCPHQLHPVEYSLIPSVVQVIIYSISFTKFSIKFCISGVIHIVKMSYSSTKMWHTQG